jgi:hypothetical protein
MHSSIKSKKISWLLLGALLLLVVPSVASAQPFGGYLNLNGRPNHGYVEIPNSPALNPTQGFTFEAWVKVSDAGSCSSIAGKGWQQTWWVGVCGTTLRSYIKGFGGAAVNFNSGTVPANVWTHVAVTFDGSFRRHYINGVQTGERADTGPLPTNTAAVRIGSDVQWQFTPIGAIDEVRLWSVARTAAQIQANRFTVLGNPTPGLIAVWSFNNNTNDSVGAYNGTLSAANASLVNPAPPAGSWLTTNELPDYQFKVVITAAGSAPRLGARESDCVPETLCVSGAVPGRSEVFVRLVGPRPNGYIWPNVVKFTTAQVEVWIQQISTGEIQYYLLSGATADFDGLPGLFDRTGFLP